MNEHIKNPKINVDELMDKIREEVTSRPRQPQLKNVTTYKPENFNSTGTVHHIFNHLNTLLSNAESRAIIRTKWPENFKKFPFNLSQPLQKVALKILNFIFKDQREVNFNVIRALKESVAMNRQLTEQITSLQTHIDERSDAANLRFDAIETHFEAIETRLQEIETRFEAIETRLQEIDERVNIVCNCVSIINDSSDDTNTKINSWITHLRDHLDAVNIQKQLIDEHLKTLDTQAQRGDERLRSVDTRLQAINEQLNSVSIHVQNLDTRHLTNDNYLKNDLIQQKHIISMFLEEAHKRLPEPFSQEQLQAFANEEQHSLDAFYVAFEDQFRGSREDIFNKLRVYLPLIQEAKVGTPDLPILDVGCGRGEWLELLGESGYTARGIDINRVMIEQSKARGLEVIESDVIAYLHSLPDASLGGVTGFHIIEHLPFEVLIKLFDETVRVLSPGGLAIFETPNPENILVATHTFYVDPTHLNPLPSTMIKFTAEARGLSKVTIMKLNSYPEDQKLSASPIAERLNSFFYGSQDYAVIGYKHG